MPLIPKQQPPYYDQIDKTKFYVALLNQTSANNPTATELINTIGNITYNRISGGHYTVTLPETINYNKTTYNTGNNNPVITVVRIMENNTTSLKIDTYNIAAGNYVDDLLTNNLIEITIYP